MEWSLRRLSLLIKHAALSYKARCCQQGSAYAAKREARAVLSPGNRAKPCKFRYVKPVGEIQSKYIAKGSLQ